MFLNDSYWDFKMEGDIATKLLFFIPFSCVCKSPSFLSIGKSVPTEVGWPWLFRDLQPGNLFQCVIIILSVHQPRCSLSSFLDTVKGQFPPASLVVDV